MSHSVLNGFLIAKAHDNMQSAWLKGCLYSMLSVVWHFVQNVPNPLEMFDFVPNCLFVGCMQKLY